MAEEIKDIKMEITVAEKMKMLEEAGFDSLSRQLLEREKLRTEIDRLTAMKFKTTSIERIRKQICKTYFKFDYNDSDFAGFSMVIVSGIALIPSSIFALNGPSGMFYLITSLIFQVIGHAICFVHKSELASKEIENWNDPIPLGAILAVKEAKAAGLKDFRIFYPVTKSLNRLLTDPVIVGFSKGVLYKSPLLSFSQTAHWWSHSGQMVEVFAWDDSKVYDAI